DLGQVTRRNGSREEFPLELEPQDDVDPVRDLVCVAPDQAGTDGVYRLDECLFVGSAKHVGKDRLELGVEPAPEATASPDEVLPRPALGLVDRARRASAERSPREGGIDV